MPERNCTPNVTLEYFDTVASAYAHNLNMSPDFSERFELFRKQMVDARSRVTTTAPRSLDIGCGPGTLAVEAGMLGFRAIGLDGSTRMLELARNAGRKRGIPLDLRLATVPLPEHLLCELEGCVDLLVASSVIEYIDDDITFAAQCRRLLSPGGIALVSFANRGSAYRRLERMLRSVGWWLRSDRAVRRHQHGEAAARELFASVGLRTRNVEYFAMPPVAYRVSRTARRPRWMATLFLITLEAPPGPVSDETRRVR